MVVTQREPPLLERAPAATPRDSFWPLEINAATRGESAAEVRLGGHRRARRAGHARLLHPTGARPAIVTLIAAMVSGVYVKYAYDGMPGWRLGRRFSRRRRGRSDRHPRVRASSIFIFYE